MSFTFYSKQERDNLAKEIKEYGLESTLREYIHDETGKMLLSALFEVAFDNLSDEDYEALVEKVCDCIGYEVDDDEE